MTLSVWSECGFPTAETEADRQAGKWESKSSNTGWAKYRPRDPDKRVRFCTLAAGHVAAKHEHVAKEDPRYWNGRTTSVASTA